VREDEAAAMSSVEEHFEDGAEGGGDATTNAAGKQSAAPVAGLRTFSFGQRVQISVASWMGSLAVSLIGRTLRWKIVGWENWEAAHALGKGLIYTFWHREIIPATWFWRKRGIVVMTSQNFDGEIIARIIRKLGYGAARGSSSRGAARALVEMTRCLRRGEDTAFTIDVPRGPRFVAKPGAVMLARASGAAILCFHVAVSSAHVFERSWDHHRVPYPFSRATIFIAPPITVSRKADDAEMERQQARVQETLDRLRAQGDEWLQQTQRN
jgi:lysophospholipid acyltransferase (LPLAT)-like uncharacterized protein